MAAETDPKSFGTFGKQAPGPVSRKSRKLFASGKQFVKLQPAYSVKLVLSYVVKGIKIKIAAKFLGARRLRFEDTKIKVSGFSRNGPQASFIPLSQRKRSTLFESISLQCPLLSFSILVLILFSPGEISVGEGREKGNSSLPSPSSLSPDRKATGPPKCI